MVHSSLIALVPVGIITGISCVYALPVWVNLVVHTLVRIYIGGVRSRKLSPFFKGSQEEPEIKPMNPQEAMRFPLVAASVLISIYLAIKYTSPELVNLLISLYFLVLGIYCLKFYIVAFFKTQSLLEFEWKYSRKIKIPYLMSEEELLEVTIQDLVAYAVSGPLGFAYFLTKNWILTNVFGLAFSINAIENLPLGSFKIGYGLLAGLLVYDVVFVFGTDIMLTVAKKIDAPIKLVFPKPGGDFSMIGLGDIILPGVFIAMALRFDLFRENKKEQKESWVYFKSCLVGYFLGILCTVGAMVVMNKEQPALLYLVPACLLSTSLIAFGLKETGLLFKYQEGED